MIYLLRLLKENVIFSNFKFTLRAEMSTEVWDAIRKFGVQKLATELGISRQAVHKWKRQNKIPPEHFMSLDRALPIPTHEIALAIWSDA